MDTTSNKIQTNSGVWLFLQLDLVVFGLLFYCYLHARARDIHVFKEYQSSLNITLGAINTLLLLTSSLFIAQATKNFQRAEEFPTPRERHLQIPLLVAAFVCGFSFLLIKLIEYSQKFDQGFTLVTNEFFMFYFVLTGIHAIHVIFGIVLLWFLIREARKPRVGAEFKALCESVAYFWHLVDLLWVLLFPLLYVIR